MGFLDSLPDIVNAFGEDKINEVAGVIKRGKPQLDNAATTLINAVGEGSIPGSNQNVAVNDFTSYLPDTVIKTGKTQLDNAVKTGIPGIPGITTAVQFSNELGSNDSNSNVPVSQSTDSHKQAIQHVKNSTPDSNYIDKKRLVEMHVYQEKKYQAYLDILNQFTFYCIILLILAILKKRFIISYSFTQILIMILIVISGIHMYLKIADVNMRNNVDFDEYDWSFTADSQSDPNKIDTNLHENTQSGGASCVEAACCNPDFTRWCSTQGLCVSNDTADCPEEQVMPDK